MKPGHLPTLIMLNARQNMCWAAKCLSVSDLICILISVREQTRTAAFPEHGRNRARDFP